jgi:hypothetical protein
MSEQPQEWVRIEPRSISINGRVVVFFNQEERDFVWQSINALCQAGRPEANLKTTKKGGEEVK